jgi:hypothetical protein
MIEWLFSKHLRKCLPVIKALNNNSFPAFSGYLFVHSIRKLMRLRTVLIYSPKGHEIDKFLTLLLSIIEII